MWECEYHDVYEKEHTDFDKVTQWEEPKWMGVQGSVCKLSCAGPRDGVSKGKDGRVGSEGGEMEHWKLRLSSVTPNSSPNGNVVHTENSWDRMFRIPLYKQLPTESNPNAQQSIINGEIVFVQWHRYT